jgi:gliding motility-associated-like protein
MNRETPKHRLTAVIAYCHVISLCVCALLLSISIKVRSQHLSLDNPSFNGLPAENAAPDGWVRLKTVDIQPGVYNITQPASDGSTYIGLHSGPWYTEGISQQLEGAMKPGYYYSTHLDLAFAPKYVFDACYGNLAIYGGNKEGELKELLWSSGEFTHTGWRRYSALFSPAAAYNWITLVAHYSTPCDKSKYGSALLLDNLSAWLFEQLKLEISTTITCANENTGAASVKVTGGTPPYQYQWLPGGGNTASIRDLPAGNYQVTVTDSKGISTQATATVKLTGLACAVTVTPSRCHGDNTNSIALETSGGLPPYRYYFNGSNTAGYTPLFDKLAPGAYRVQVKDEQGCLYEKSDILVQEPPPLQIRRTAVKPCSCSEVNNGQIIPLISGGVPPYEYRLSNGLWQVDSVLAQLPPGNYQYEIKDSNGCGGTGAGEILSPYKNCLVILPTAFSPNGDGNNDVFRPKVYDDIHNYQLSIYNRWGGLVFRSNDPAIGWNGTDRGSPAMVQHYIYVCTYVDRNAAPQELKGAVMLVR